MFQLWRWNGNRLCNYFGLFVSKVNKGPGFDHMTGEFTTIFKILMRLSDPTASSLDQTWNSTAMGQLVSSDGSCLGVENNSDSHDASLSAGSCDKKEKGQFWSFIPRDI